MICATFVEPKKDFSLFSSYYFGIGDGGGALIVDKDLNQS
jgi:hypothetical protein